MSYQRTQQQTSFTTKIFAVFLLMFGLALSTSANALLISVDADAKVRFGSSSLSTTNFGSSANLTADQSGGSFSSLSFIRFDLASLLDNALTSSLSLFGFNNSPAANVAIYGLNDGDSFESWTESVITGSSAQTAGVILSNAEVNTGRVNFLGNIITDNPTISDKEYIFSSSILTDFINNDTDNLITLILLDTSTTAAIGGTTFHSKESNNASFAPALTVAPVPLPAAVWLLGSGLLGLVTFRRKQKV